MGARREAEVGRGQGRRVMMTRVEVGICLRVALLVEEVGVVVLASAEVAKRLRKLNSRTSFDQSWSWKM